MKMIEIGLKHVRKTVPEAILHPAEQNTTPRHATAEQHAICNAAKLRMQHSYKQKLHIYNLLLTGERLETEPTIALYFDHVLKVV